MPTLSPPYQYSPTTWLRRSRAHPAGSSFCRSSGISDRDAAKQRGGLYSERPCSNLCLNNPELLRRHARIAFRFFLLRSTIRSARVCKISRSNWLKAFGSGESISKIPNSSSPSTSGRTTTDLTPSRRTLQHQRGYQSVCLYTVAAGEFEYRRPRDRSEDRDVHRSGGLRARSGVANHFVALKRAIAAPVASVSTQTCANSLSSRGNASSATGGAIASATLVARGLAGDSLGSSIQFNSFRTIGR